MLQIRIGNGGEVHTGRLLQKAKERESGKPNLGKMPVTREGGKYRATHNGTVKTYPPAPKPQAYLANMRQESEQVQ